MARKLFVVDDDLIFAKLLAANLRNEGSLAIELFPSAQAMLERRAEEPPDAVITDLMMPDMDGIELTRQLRASEPTLPIFVLTASTEIGSAIAALKAGATDYLTKPVNVDELMTQLRRAIEERPMRDEAVTLEKTRKAKFSAGAILGDEPAIESVREFVRRVAAIPNSTVLLLGESGTGKNLVARTLHYTSGQAKARFVEINCSALPAHLLEAELFGYQRGAFTDARESKRGLIEVANGGTLFLDEIGELSPELQAKLLNVLESRRFRRVGGTEEIEVNLRLIAATNRDLEAHVRAGRFRQDLYYRICVVTCTLPPLRGVASAIPLLADHFRELFNRQFKKSVKGIDAGVVERLTAWHWPGNVRELRNVIEHAAIVTTGETLRVPAVEDQDAPVGAKPPTLDETEREAILRALETTGGRIKGPKGAASALGLHASTLYHRMKKLGIRPPGPGQDGSA